MVTKDINLHESGNGGEMAIISNDLLIGESLFQQVYLALFGGNIEAVTRGDELITEERFDYWANPLFFSEIPSKQFNSITEKTINSVALNSQGRLSIINAINEDLSYLTELLNYSIDVQIFEVNKIRIIINFTPKNNQQSRVLQLVYDNAKNELIIERTI
jgi:phage gp46-like protein